MSKSNITARLQAAVKDVVELAERQAAKYRPVMLFCRPGKAASWQESEFQHFFLSGIYGDVTGAKQACNSQIMALVVTAGARDYIAANCPNPYWLWATVAAAAKGGSTLPMTQDEIEHGVQQLFEQHAAAISKGCSISGHPKDYSGPYTAWHLRDSFDRGYLWNNDSDRERGLEHGFLLLERAPLSGKSAARLLGGIAGAVQNMDGMRLVFNPLFYQHAAAEPVSSEN